MATTCATICASNPPALITGFCPETPSLDEDTIQKFIVVKCNLPLPPNTAAAISGTLDTLATWLVTGQAVMSPVFDITLGEGIFATIPRPGCNPELMKYVGREVTATTNEYVSTAPVAVTVPAHTVVGLPTIAAYTYSQTENSLYKWVETLETRTDRILYVTCSGKVYADRTTVAGVNTYSTMRSTISYDWKPEVINTSGCKMTVNKLVIKFKFCGNTMRSPQEYVNMSQHPILKTYIS